MTYIYTLTCLPRVYLLFLFIFLSSTVFSQSDVSVRVTSNSSTFSQFTYLTFFVVVKNNGPNTATGVICNAPQPAGTANNCNKTTVGFWRNYDTGDWVIGNLNAGESVTLQATVYVLANDVVTMSASVTSTSSDPESNNNNASQSATVGATAPYLSCESITTTSPDSVNLAITLSGNASEINFGLTESFLLTLKNTSSKNANNVKVQLNIPAGMVFQVAYLGGLGTFDGATGIWNVGTMTANSSHEITVNAKIIQGGSLKCYAQVIACDLPDINSKPDNYKDVAVEDDESDFNILGLYADLSMQAAFKTFTPIVKLGDNITLVATLTNAGPTRADGVKIRSYIPSGLQFVSATTTIGIFDNSLGVWLLSDTPDPNNFNNKPGFTIEANASQTLEITFKAIQLEQITYDVEVRSDNVPDPNSSPSNFNLSENDEAQVIFSVNATTPVELISFEGKESDGGANLTWVTLTEINNAYFEMAKSFDGIHFEPVGKVIGVGNSSKKQNYFFRDAVLNQLTYYRLNQIDNDGTSTPSKIISVAPKTFSSNVNIYPNPTKNKLTIDLGNENTSSKIFIYNAQGFLINSFSNEDTHNHLISTDFTDYPSGNYFIRVVTNNKSDITRRVTIAH